MDFWEVLEGRRSVRMFENRPVERELIKKLIKAGTMAPNAHNRQSWRFVVVTEKEDLTRMVLAMQPKYKQALLNSGMFQNQVDELAEKRKARLTSAPAAILPCVAKGDLPSYGDDERTEGEWMMAVQSAALAAGNILLAAHAFGLGGVWICAPMFAPAAVCEAFDLPADWVAQGMLMIGYPAEEPEFRERKPMKEVVHWVS
ncbi:MAG: nitroreductase family protein [Anaerolineales bacterium]|nr:nitroreductase family protein [Anaerolineales bacterium]